jgi:uncharacterized membrane protein
LNPNPLSVREAVDFAWARYKEHYGLLTAFMLTFFAAWVILEVIVIAGQRFGYLLWAIAHLSFFVVFAGLEVGFIQTCLVLHDGKPVSYSDIFRGLSLGVRFFTVQLVYFVTVLIGLVLLVVPGIYFGIRYSFYGFYLVKGNLDLKQSFQQSAVACQGSMRFLFWFYVLVFLFNILGASIFGLGLIVTIPLSTLMKAFIYRQLKEASPGPE